MRYMIHLVPDRQWYVDDFIVPSMIEQGIDENDIYIWCDSENRGNLYACMDCFTWCGNNPTDGTWHLQDDIIISRKFAKTTEKYNDGVVCGFCVKDWGPDYTRVGIAPVQYMWYSFHCIRIPDEIAGECALWFYKDASRRINSEYKMRIRRRKHDDDFFQYFLFEKYPDMNIRNLKPNIVDHIDYLIGGSLINSDRKREINRAVWWEEEDLVIALDKALNKV